MIVRLYKKTLLTNREFDKWKYSLYMFILIFAPPFIPYPHLLLTLFSFILLLTNYRNMAESVFKKSGICEWVIVMILLAAYTICIAFPISVACNDVVNISHYVSTINRYGVLVVTVSICAVFFICSMSKKRYGLDFCIECLINAGIIEGVLAILSFLSPSVKNFFIFLMEKFSDPSLYSNRWYITVRSYGFASTLVDVFGMGIGILAGICFFYGVNRKRKYIFVSLIIATATLLNSRTGLIIYVISIIITIFFTFKKENVRKMISILISLFLMFIFASEVIKLMSTNEYTASWVNSGIDSIINFINGKSSAGNNNDAMSLLFQQNFWKLPSFPRIIFGTGHSLYEAEGYSHSDVGYVNELWLYGILGCILLYGEIIKLCVTTWKRSKDSVIKFSSIFLLVAYFFFNIKGAALGYNPGAVSMFIVIFICKYQNSVRKCEYE